MLVVGFVVLLFVRLLVAWVLGAGLDFLLFVRLLVAWVLGAGLDFLLFSFNASFIA